MLTSQKVRCRVKIEIYYKNQYSSTDLDDLFISKVNYSRGPSLCVVVSGVWGIISKYYDQLELLESNTWRSDGGSGQPRR